MQISVILYNHRPLPQTPDPVQSRWRNYLTAAFTNGVWHLQSAYQTTVKTSYATFENLIFEQRQTVLLELPAHAKVNLPFLFYIGAKRF